MMNTIQNRYDPVLMSRIINAAIVRGSMTSEELKALEELGVFQGTRRVGNRIEEAERKYAKVSRLARILELRRDGLTWEQMANELGYTLHKCRFLHREAIAWANHFIKAKSVNSSYSSYFIKYSRFDK